MTTKAFKIVRPDAKGRITLGPLAKGVSSFKIVEDKQHRIILEPRMEVPINDKWLLHNKIVLTQGKQGAKNPTQWPKSILNFKGTDIKPFESFRDDLLPLDDKNPLK